MRTNKTNRSYIGRVATLIDYAVHNLQKIGNIDPRDFVNDTDFASDISTDSPATVEMVNVIKDNFDEDDLVKFQELLLDAEKPLCEGCPNFTKLSAIIKLLNLKGYPGNDIDVFLEPLVDDLHTLFETGVDTYDASIKDNFNLRVVVLWTINDYPALGTLCGYPYSGFKGCVVCGKDIKCVRLSASSKQSYVGHRRYLPYNHPFRKQKKAFNGQQEFLLAPNPMTGEQIYNEVQHIENKWGKGKRTNNKASENQEDTRGRGGKIQKQKRNTTKEEGGSSQVNGQNENNVTESLVRTLLNVLGKTKDGVNARLDLAELGGKTKVVCYARRRQNNTTSSRLNVNEC
ncbi:retrovirus-related pol polyprotein from transposon TNT 1-94 [Tanacetum coccineum]